MSEKIYHVVKIGGMLDAEDKFEQELNKYPPDDYELVGYTSETLEVSTVYTAVFKIKRPQLLDSTQ